MKCGKCQRRLRADAVACLCGWTAADPVRALHIDCCFVGCPKSALVRIFTATGWANVCIEHYPVIERKPYIQHSPRIQEVLDACAKAKSKLETVVEGEVVREPGADDEKVAA